jgi:hypothetical protein
MKKNTALFVLTLAAMPAVASPAPITGSPVGSIKLVDSGSLMGRPGAAGVTQIIADASLFSGASPLTFGDGPVMDSGDQGFSGPGTYLLPASPDLGPTGQFGPSIVPDVVIPTDVGSGGDTLGGPLVPLPGAGLMGLAGLAGIAAPRRRRAV